MLSRKEFTRIFQLLGQIFFNDVVQAPHRQSLLFRTDTHRQQLLNRRFPLLLALEEGVILEGVLGTLDIDILQGVGWKFVIDDVLRGYSQIGGIGNTEEAINVRGVTRSDLQGSINIGDPVGIAIDEGVNRNFGLFAESANESAGSSGWGLPPY